MLREKNVGGFLSETFDMIGRNIVPVALFVIVVGGATAIGYALGYSELDGTLARVGAGFSVDTDEGFLSSLYDIGILVLSLIANYFLLAQFLTSSGRLQSTETRIWAYVGLFLVSWIGTLFGFLLLVIPGIFLLVKWSTVMGFLIGEREGVFDSMKRSWDLTEGYGWQIFFSGLVLGLGLFGIGMIIGVAGGAIGSTILLSVMTGLTESFSNAIFMAFGIAIFTLLHDNSEAVSEVFE